MAQENGDGEGAGKGAGKELKKDEGWEGQAMKAIWATGLMTFTVLAGSASAGEIAKPVDAGKPNYFVSPAVKRDRRLVIDTTYLKHYAKQDAPVGEGFWITERDGAMMLVDPHISQNLR